MSFEQFRRMSVDIQIQNTSLKIHNFVYLFSHLNQSYIFLFTQQIKDWIMAVNTLVKHPFLLLCLPPLYKWKPPFKELHEDWTYHFEQSWTLWTVRTLSWSILTIPFMITEKQKANDGYNYGEFSLHLYINIQKRIFSLQAFNSERNSFVI